MERTRWQAILRAAIVTAVTLAAGSCSNDMEPSRGGLTLTAVTPASGPASGGTAVSLNGFNFSPNVSVSFGSTPAASVQFADSTRVVAVTPAHAPGAVDVVVGSGGQTTSLTGAFTYTN
jgi:hypothetical protein